MKGRPLVASRNAMRPSPLLGRLLTLCRQDEQAVSATMCRKPVVSAHEGTAFFFPLERVRHFLTHLSASHRRPAEELFCSKWSSRKTRKDRTFSSKELLQSSSVKKCPVAESQLGSTHFPPLCRAQRAFGVKSLATVTAGSKLSTPVSADNSQRSSGAIDETNTIRRTQFPRVRTMTYKWASFASYSGHPSSLHSLNARLSFSRAVCRQCTPRGNRNSGWPASGSLSCPAIIAPARIIYMFITSLNPPMVYNVNSTAHRNGGPPLIVFPLSSAAAPPAPLQQRRSQQQHFRCFTYVEAHGKMTAAQTMTDPVDILNFFVANADASTALLSTCLRRIANVSSEEKMREVVKDERFQHLIRLLEARVDDCDARMLTQLCQALYRFRKHTEAIAELGRRVSSVVVRRENAFSPKNIASLVFAFSWLRLDNMLALHEFLLAEAMKLLAEMDPTDVVTLLDGFRRMGVGSKETTNLLLEKLTDDVDRFTSRDVVALLKSMSFAGTARGFLLRRVATLAFDNLDTFTPRQLASILCSLTRLRFATVQNCDQLFSLLRPSLHALPAAALYEILEALTLVAFPQVAAINECIEALWEAGNGDTMPLTYAVAVVYAILQFELHDKTDMAKQLLEAICQRSPPEGRLNNMKLGEIFAAVDLEETCPKVEVPPHWRAAVDQTSRSELERLESSGMHNEVMLLLDSLRGKYQLQIQRNQQAGPYWVEFLDEETKICLDVDSVYSPTTRTLKFRHLKSLGYHPILIDSWQWRRLRSEVDQVIFLKQQLAGPLIELERLDSDILG